MVCIRWSDSAVSDTLQHSTGRHPMAVPHHSVGDLGTLSSISLEVLSILRYNPTCGGSLLPRCLCCSKKVEVSLMLRYTLWLVDMALWIGIGQSSKTQP